VKIALFLLVIASLHVAAAAPISNSSPTAPDANFSTSSFIKLTPQVEDILTSTATFYQGSQTMEVDFESHSHSETSKTTRDSTSTFHLAFKRPDRFSMIIQSGLNGRTQVSDGKRLISYEPARNRFASSIAPPSLEEILRPGNLQFIACGAPLGYEKFLERDFIKQFETNLVKCEFLGSEKMINDIADHIRLTTNAGFISDYWIAEGRQPLLLKAEWHSDIADFIKSKSKDWVKKNLGDDMLDSKVSRVTTYNNWGINQTIPETTFQYEPPKGANQVIEFDPDRPHPMLGKMAPDFQLHDLDGHQIKLSDLRGKIVVVDFWFANCPPCIASLPVLMRVASARQAQGVVFYAINSIDSAETIRAFQKKQGLDFFAMTDSDQKVVNLYQVQGFPISFVIDREGKIQAVDQGYNLDRETKLSSEIDTLLSRKSSLSVSQAQR
jgi:peroxiredoxin/outer membrane lipoprotein-sorting protein